MNTQAAFKTLAVVLAIGALTGFNEWRKVYGVQLGKGAAPVGQAKASASAPVEVNGLHYSPSGQVQTQSREQCLAQLEEARKRSPHGLAPEWEQRQKARCADLYSEAASQ